MIPDMFAISEHRRDEPNLPNCPRQRDRLRSGGLRSRLGRTGAARAGPPERSAPPCTDDIPNNDGYMRPKGRVEGASHLVRTSRRRRDGLPSFPAQRFGLRIPKGNGDVSPHRDILRISCECVEVKTAGTETQNGRASTREQECAY